MLDRGQDVSVAQMTGAPVNSFGAGHAFHGDHWDLARAADLDGGRNEDAPQNLIASVNQLANGRTCSDLQQGHAVGNTLGGVHPIRDAQSRTDPANSLLGIAADSLDQVESTRIALGNQLAALESGKDFKSPRASLAERREYRDQVALFALLKQAEHQAELALNRAVRQHPLYGWIKNALGIGEKQGARLLAAIGDPAWNTAEGRPRRGPAELWAYCGYAPGQKRRKGVKSNWNAAAKMRAFLCAEASVKAGVRKLDGADDSDGYDYQNRKAISPLGQKYLDARKSWVGRETSEGHKHNHALRVVAKEILKDLWREAGGATRSASPNEAPPLPPTDLAGAKPVPRPRTHAPQPALSEVSA